MASLPVFCLACGLDKIAKVMQEAAAVPLTSAEKKQDIGLATNVSGGIEYY